MSERLSVSLEMGGRVLWLRLAAPPGNVIDQAMMKAIIAALDAHGESPLAAVVFEGSGKHFSFGASVEEHTRERVGEMLPSFHAVFRRLECLAVPTVAVVRGQCLGGGLELAAWCSWIFAAPEAAFGQPEIKLGVFPPMGSILLEWRLGGGRALDLLLTGRSIRAAEAQAMGLVHQVGPEPEVAARAFIAAELLVKSASSLRFAERAARAGLSRLLEQRLPELERMYLEELMRTADANEGIQSFLEKRAAEWSHAKGAT